MRRPIRLVVAGLALFLLAAGAGMLVAAQWGPERTRAAVEASLSDSLGTPVQVGSARLYFGGTLFTWMRGLLLDVEDVSAALEPGRDPEDPTPGAEIHVERMQADLRALALLRGDVTVHAVALEGLRITIEDPMGAREPAAEAPPAPAEAPVAAGKAPVAEAEASAAGAEAGAYAEPLVGPLETLAGAVERLLARPTKAETVAIERASLRIEGPPLAEGAPPWRLALDDVAGEVRLGPPGRAARVALSGRLADDGDGAPVELSLARDRRGGLRARASVQDLSLASTAPVLMALLPQARLQGRGTLVLEASRPQKGVFQLAGQLDAREISGALPRMGDGRPIPVDLASAQAGIELDVDPERLRVGRAFAGSDRTRVQLSGEIERPLRMSSNTVAEVGLDRYDLANREAVVSFLPPGQIRRIENVLEPVHSGRVEDVRVTGSASLRDWLRAFDDERPGLLPESVEARARFQGFSVVAGEDETIRDLSGTVVWRGDRIDLQRVRGRRAGHWMPLLDARLDGISNLGGNADWPEIPESADAPVMLGLRPMYDIVVDPNKPPGEMPRELMLSIEHVIHPTLVWSLRNLFVRANPGEDGIRLLLEHGLWGRVPIRAEGVWTMQPDGERRVERVAVRIEAKPPLEDLKPLDRTNPVWARGRWHLDAHNLGAWRVLSSTGSFQAQRHHVRLVSYDLDLGTAGRALGEGSVDFSSPEELPYWTTVRVIDAKAGGIVDKIGFEPHEATGDVVLDGQLQGELRPGRRVMAGMEGRLTVQARNGAILKRLPVILAMAKATDTFNPFGSRDEMHYSEIDADLRIDRGIVHAEDLRINGSDLRLLASGHVDAIDPLHPVQAVVGIFFFKALDRMIGVVPVLSDLILGEDENLMGAYVELTGPWADPDASLVPLKTVAAGPASFALEGVPRFVRRAITAIQSALTRPAPELPPAPDVASPPPAPVGEDS